MIVCGTDRQAAGAPSGRKACQRTTVDELVRTVPVGLPDRAHKITVMRDVTDACGDVRPCQHPCRDPLTRHCARISMKAAWARSRVAAASAFE